MYEFSSEEMKILPSPILPVFALSSIAATVWSTMSDVTTISSLIFGNEIHDIFRATIGFCMA